jgi:Zn-dependent M28 family amino/carboxypeptidase
MNTISSIDQIISQISTERLQGYVRKIEGLRHGWENYGELEKRASFIENTFKSFQYAVTNQDFLFHDRTYRNIVATIEGNHKEKERILLGAHYDAAWGSPGADDNASGVAVLLEVAGILSRQSLGRTVQCVAFTLEEPQPQTIHFLIGSETFAQEAKKSKISYQAVLILESVGYTDTGEGSQIVPLLVRASVPKKGTFLGVVANSRSKSIMETFRSVSREHVPALETVTYAVPMSGRFIPETRFSDHASFWNAGYPALMLTDTAMFRNPHYHTHHDRYETLDFEFITNVAKAVLSVILKLANDRA